MQTIVEISFADMLALLFKPYPLYISVERKLLSSVFLGVFVALFLMVFQPFGTGGHDFEYKYWFLAGYGLITASVTLLLGLFLKPRFAEKNWTVLRQIVWLLLNLMLNVVCCYIYFIVFFGYAFGWYNLVLFMGYVLSIGVLPFSIITLVSYIYQLRKNQAITTNINQQITEQTGFVNSVVGEFIELTEENKKDQLKLNVEELLFIKASNNYVEIHLQKAEKAERILFRGNLKYVEEQIHNASIVRCHRSYLVNLEMVSQTSGNAQGYRLHFAKNATTVPVSRSQGKSIMDRFKQLQ